MIGDLHKLQKRNRLDPEPKRTHPLAVFFAFWPRKRAQTGPSLGSKKDPFWSMFFDLVSGSTSASFLYKLGIIFDASLMPLLKAKRKREKNLEVH